MTLAEFHNGLRILCSIDLYELQEVGLLFNASPKPAETNGNEAWQEWRKFRADPYRYLIRCDDDTAEKIWSIMVRRGAVKSEPAHTEERAQA